jgi:hypothetical protein
MAKGRGYAGGVAAVVEICYTLLYKSYICPFPYVDGVVTAGDEGEINYEIWWYDKIGTVEFKKYFVEYINHDVLRNPEYTLFYWIELVPCE